MTPQELDVIIRVAGATLLLAAIPLLNREERRVRWFFAPLALCLCGFLSGNTPDAALRLSGTAGHLAYVLTGFSAAFLWWFCLAVFDRTFRPRGAVLAVGLGWIVIAAADRGLFGQALAQVGLSRALIVIGFGMVGHLTWRILRDRPGDLVVERRGARVAVVLLLAAQLLADLVVDVVMGFDWQPRAFSITQNAAVLGFTGWLLILGLKAAPVRTSTPAVRPPAPPSAAAPAPADERLTRRLRVLIEVERAHLDPELTFDRFVRLMQAPDRVVRRLINRQLGFDHFRSFLNHHRMEEARRLLADPSRSHDKLIAIAMDSGFASLASFNRVFQDVEHCTPGAFRRSARTESATASGRDIPPFEKRPADF